MYLNHKHCIASWHIPSPLLFSQMLFRNKHETWRLLFCSRKVSFYLYSHNFYSLIVLYCFNVLTGKITNWDSCDLILFPAWLSERWIWFDVLKSCTMLLLYHTVWISEINIILQWLCLHFCTQLVRLFVFVAQSFFREVSKDMYIHMCVFNVTMLIISGWQLLKSNGHVT